MSEAPKDRVIFIGLNKCGTSSMHYFCQKSGMSAVHWKFYDRKFIALVMLNNIALGRRPFEGYEHRQVFSDLSYADTQLYVEGVRFFRELHAAYPDAYFILNTRSLDRWIASRSAHETEDGSLLARVQAATDLSEDEIVADWRRLFETHHTEVRAHFAGYDRFLEFNIETDAPERLVDFLAPVHKLDLKNWIRRNKTAPA